MSELAPESVNRVPYEALASSMATDFFRELKEEFGDDPRVLISYLPQVLPQLVLESIETGLGLADHFPSIGPVDLMEAYVAGIEQSKAEGGA